MRARGEGGPPGRRLGAHGVRLQHFHDPAAIQAAAPWGRFSLTPLRGAGFSASLLDLDLGEILLQGGECSPAFAVGRLPADTAGILLPLHATPLDFYCGASARPRTVLICGAGAEYEIAGRGPSRWALIMVSTSNSSTLHALGPDASMLLRPAATVCIVPPGMWKGIALLVRRALGVARRTPGVFAVEEARRSLRASLLEGLHDLLIGASKGDGPQRRVQASSWRRRIVHAADRMVQADPAHAGDLPSVAAMIGTKESELRAAFLAVLGISASRYVLRRRLLMARAILSSAEGLSPPAVAAAHGFARFDPFRRAYGAMFGRGPPGLH